MGENMREVNECSLYKDGHCTKWRKNGKCRPSTEDWLDERLDVCDINAMCEKSSIFGNEYYYVTDEDIEALKSGKVLYKRSEYGIFIGYMPETGDEQVDERTY